MKSTIFAFGFAASAVAIPATYTVDQLTPAARDLPECAMSCWEPGAKKLGCAANDLYCLNYNYISWRYDTDSCIHKACDVSSEDGKWWLK